MIAWTKLEFPIGTVLETVTDFDNVKHIQPAKILRKATKEEYVEYYKSVTGTIGNLSLLDGLFFYEISTD